MENGKPATTALINLFSRFSSVRFSSLVVLRVCVVLFSLDVRIHSPFRSGVGLGQLIKPPDFRVVLARCGS